MIWIRFAYTMFYLICLMTYNFFQSDEINDTLPTVQRWVARQINIHMISFSWNFEFILLRCYIQYLLLDLNASGDFESESGYSKYEYR